jgi:hypothetical protein
VLVMLGSTVIMGEWLSWGGGVLTLRNCCQGAGYFTWTFAVLTVRTGARVGRKTGKDSEQGSGERAT